MKQWRPWLGLFGLVLVVLYSFLSRNTDLVLRSCFILGFTSGFFLLSIPRANRIKYGVLSILTTPFSFAFTILYFSIPFYFHWTIFIPTAITLAGFIIGFLINKLPVQRSYKIAFLICLLAVFIIAGSHKFGEGWFAVISIISYTVAAVFLSEQKGNKLLLITIFILPTLIIFISNSDIPVLFLPVELTASLIAVAVIFQFKGTTANYLKILVLNVFCSLLAWPLNENYTHWYYSTMENRRIDVKHKLPEIITSKTVKLKSSKVNVYLIWSAHCGKCKYEYPYFSSLADEFSGNDDVTFSSVFLQTVEKDSIFYNEKIKEKYSFEWSKAVSAEKLMNDFEISGVPSLLIINEKGKVYYNGFCRIRPWLFINNPKEYIKKSLKDLS